jgi:hypothetical protein
MAVQLFLASGRSFRFHNTIYKRFACSRSDEVNGRAALGPGVHSGSKRNEYQKLKNNNISGG